MKSVSSSLFFLLITYTYLVW